MLTCKLSEVNLGLGQLHLSSCLKVRLCRTDIDGHSKSVSIHDAQQVVTFFLALRVPRHAISKWLGNKQQLHRLTRSDDRLSHILAITKSCSTPSPLKYILPRYAAAIPAGCLNR
jgi:hypothetical protein